MIGYQNSGPLFSASLLHSLFLAVAKLSGVIFAEQELDPKKEAAPAMQGNALLWV